LIIQFDSFLMRDFLKLRHEEGLPAVLRNTKSARGLALPVAAQPLRQSIG
jgi:hypothetical protein